MKKALAVLLALSMSLVMLAGCGAASSASAPAASSKAVSSSAASGSASTASVSGKKVAVLIPGSVAYFTATRAGSEEAAKKYGLELTFFDGNWDVATQLSQIEDAITSGFDMIALCSCDAEGILPGIKAANEAKVPIMTFTNAIGTDASGTVDGVVTYVGQDEVETGKLCAQIASSLLGDKGGKVVCIEGKSGTYPQIYRTKGFEEGIQGKNIEIVYTQSGEWDKNKAMSIMEDLIQANTEMNLVFCQDDGMAAGVGQVLKENNLKDKVYVVGLGGSKDGLAAMKDGLIDGDTFMSAKDEGYKAIEACAKALGGEKVDTRTVMTQVEVNKDNLDTFTPEW